LWNSTVLDWIKILILGVVVFAMGPVPPITFLVIVESYFLNTKFHFAGFDLNASFGKRCYQRLINLE